MGHFITEIEIDKLRHLSGITISLNPEARQHLMVTGKNGSGKTSLLLALRKYLQAVNYGRLTSLNTDYVRWLRDAERKRTEALTEAEKFEAEKNYQEKLGFVQNYQDGVRAAFCQSEDLDALYEKGEFIIAFFPANRMAKIIPTHGVENIKLNTRYNIGDSPGELLMKYMVHLKTQQAYARNEGDLGNVDKIQAWFDRFTNALKVLLDDGSIEMAYDYKEYNFKIHEDGRDPFGFDELSDGYSSVIHIVSDLILRMDKNWLLGDSLSQYNTEGIVLIDELETHLHIELQKKILPFLVEFFPRIQFIVTTHSPYILNSIPNAKAYDLETCMELENTFVYSSDGLAEAFFDADEYSDELKKSMERYEYLKGQAGLNEEERAERARLRSLLKNIPKGFSKEARDKFEEIEGNSV